MMKRMNLTPREQELVLALRQEANIHNHAIAEAIKAIEETRVAFDFPEQIAGKFLEAVAQLRKE